MKMFFHLLNGIASQIAANFNLRNCVALASLLITSPAYALDGEGWGAIIQGVTEILHNNQQQEIKQREEQRLEQQRFQEQQVDQIRQQNLQLANNSDSSNQSCKHIINQKVNTIKKWSGSCYKGYLYGDGELILFLSSVNEYRKYVGRFSDGYFAGVMLRHDLEKNGQILPNTTHLIGYYENNESLDIPVAVKINNNLKGYAYKDFDWYSIQANSVRLDRKISFDEAMIIVKNFMSTKVSDSMSYERFRAYLEGKLVFDPSQAVAQQTSSLPSTESSSEATDEPPQKGIFLDRRKKPSSKKKK